MGHVAEESLVPGKRKALSKVWEGPSYHWKSPSIFIGREYCSLGVDT